jgi:hypothetical protein
MRAIVPHTQVVLITPMGHALQGASSAGSGGVALVPLGSETTADEVVDVQLEYQAGDGTWHSQDTRLPLTMRQPFQIRMEVSGAAC